MMQVLGDAWRGAVNALLLERVLLCVIGLTLPFSEAADLQFLAGIALLACHCLRRGRPWPAGGWLTVDWCFFVLCSWRVASYFWSEYPAVSLQALRVEMPPSLACYLGVRAVLNAQPRAAADLVASLVVSGVLALFVGDASGLWPDLFPFPGLDWQLRDTVLYGTYLATSLPLLFLASLFWRPEAAAGVRIPFVLVLALMTAAAVYLLRSRMFALSVVVLACSLLVVMTVRWPKLQNRWFTAAVLIALVLAAGYGEQWSQHQRSDEFDHQSAAVSKVVGGERAIIFRYWLKWYAERGSWRGWGVGFWGPAHVIQRYGLVKRDLGGSLSPHEREMYFLHGHNVFLNALLQTGAVGATLLVGFCVLPLRLLFRRRRDGAVLFPLLLAALTTIQFVAKNASDDGECGGVWVYCVVATALCMSSATCSSGIYGAMRMPRNKPSDVNCQLAP